MSAHLFHHKNLLSTTLPQELYTHRHIDICRCHHISMSLVDVSSPAIVKKVCYTSARNLSLESYVCSLLVIFLLVKDLAAPTCKMSKTFINFSTAQVFINKLNRAPPARPYYVSYIRIFLGSHFHEQHSHLTF